MEDRDKKTELLVGLFLFIGLLLLGTLILQFGSVREVFKTTYEITVPFPDANGVKEGTPVVLGGSKIGKVPRIPKLNDQFNGVIIPLEIYQDKKIPSDSKFTIGTAGLLGDSFIEIRTSGKPTESYIKPGTVLTKENVGSSGGLGALQDSASQISKKADLVMDDLRSALVDIKEVVMKVNKDALGPKTIKDFGDSMEHLNQTMTRVDTQVLGDDNANNLKTAISELKEAATSFKSVAQNLDSQVKRLGPMFDKLDPAISKADNVMTDLDASLKSIKVVTDNLGAATKGMKAGDGLLKALFSDEKLKTDFKDLISNIKRNGVLFYKDNSDKIRAEEEEKRPSSQPLRRPNR